MTENLTEMNPFKVRMIMGNDTCTTQTMIIAKDAETAAREAEMKWTGIVVRIVSVEGPEGCDTALCEDDDHWCCNCDVTHLDDDGTCFNCSY